MRSNLARANRSQMYFGTREIAIGWRWRDRHGAMHAPQGMETRHLFYTFRMIWNNHMPEDARVGAVRLYNFPACYTSDYMADAVVAIGRELLVRDDLTDDWRRQLQRMAHWFAEFEAVNDGRIPSPRLLLS